MSHADPEPKNWLQQLALEREPEHQGLSDLQLPDNQSQAWQQIQLLLGLSPWALANWVAEFFSMECADFGHIEPQALQLVPESLARRHQILPLRLENNRLEVALSNPMAYSALQEVRFVAGRPVTALIAPPEELENQISLSYGHNAEQQEIRLGELTVSHAHSQQAGAKEQPIIRLARLVLQEAIKLGASDLHIQPFVGGGMIRCRVDGLLRRITTLPHSVFKALIRYFKVQSGMDSANELIPQDGRMSLQYEQRQVELRLSCLPGKEGERLVLRLLEQSRRFNLEQQHFSTHTLQALRRISQHSNGIFLVTGPTGSGKSSTLYAMLAELNQVDKNLITVEDPVEYRLLGASQVEVHDKTGLTFAQALRSILRQDPDVILIGEIRDQETAEIAVQAALTGHLVLTTLHTNNALSSFARLQDLGISPALIADSLIGISAQRLLRRLCPKCKQRPTEPLSATEQAFAELLLEPVGARPQGCSHCGFSGYQGRIPVTELLEVNSALRNALLAGADSSALSQFEPKKNLAESARDWIVSGDTSVEEALRVLGPSFWHQLAHQRQRPIPNLSGLEDNSRAHYGTLVLTHTPEAFDCLGQGFNPFFVNSPEAARQALEQNSGLSLLLLDLADDDPLQLLQALRRSLAWCGLPVLLLLDNPDPELVSALLAQGVSDYLEKPLDAEVLMDRLRGLTQR